MTPGVIEQPILLIIIAAMIGLGFVIGWAISTMAYNKRIREIQAEPLYREENAPPDWREHVREMAKP